MKNKRQIHPKIKEFFDQNDPSKEYTLLQKLRLKKINQEIINAKK